MIIATDDQVRSSIIENIEVIKSEVLAIEFVEAKGSNDPTTVDEDLNVQIWIEKAQIEAQIKRLEAIEIDYRNRLRNWLSGMLNDLGAQLNDSIENTEPVNVITSAPENQ